MKAMLLNAFGESFQSAEIDTPAPAPGQVLIKVEASSVNPIDTKIRAGLVAPVSPNCPAFCMAMLQARSLHWAKALPILK